jgi:hypothetical protein
VVVVLFVLFIVSWLVRVDARGEPEAIPIVLSLVGVGLAGLTGWLEGKLVDRLVDRLVVGVDDGAYLNSPSALSGCPAREGSPGRKEGRGDSLANQCALKGLLMSTDYRRNESLGEELNRRC